MDDTSYKIDCPSLPGSLFLYEADSGEYPEEVSYTSYARVEVAYDSAKGWSVKNKEPVVYTNKYNCSEIIDECVEILAADIRRSVDDGLIEQLTGTRPCKFRDYTAEERATAVIGWEMVQQSDASRVKMKPELKAQMSAMWSEQLRLRVAAKAEKEAAVSNCHWDPYSGDDE